MSKKLLILAIAVAAPILVTTGCSPGSGMSGEEIFSLHCVSCHPGGGNTIKPDKTLTRKDLEANNIRTPGDIVNRMRNPGVGMPRFARNIIPDKDAEKVAEYILATFR